MNTTRRAFLNAGSIIAIIVAVVFTLLAIISIVVAPIVTADNLAEVYEKDTASYKTYYVNGDKAEGYDYFVELNDRGEETRTIIYIEDLDDLAKITQTFLKSVGWVTLVLSVASFIVSIFVMKEANRLTNHIAPIITLLVLSLCLGNLVTFAFMIVGLCLKNKPIMEIVNEQSGSSTNA